MQNNKPAESLEKLIEDAQKGNVTAFEKIVKYHQSYIYAIAFRFLCDEDDAEDVVQESFIRIWNHLNVFDPNMKFTTWMYKIVVNLCYDKAKSNKRRIKVFSRLNNNSLKEDCIDSTDMEQELMNKEIAVLIKSIADGLSEKQRMIFLLRDFQDLTIQEVVDITGMSESGIKTNLFFARQNIRKKLAMLEASV
ncbi:MAG: RNA polymerase sigma factor [Ignavibacteriales bacterium]|nr:RNA polymerase sigma factor [Ignavibacteriales bacterium]